MKVSKAQASHNRDSIIRAAAAQIRERGFDRMSVADVARDAGLTHGALYSHFRSKDLLKAEATKRAFDDCICSFSSVSLHEFLAMYLSVDHRDSPYEGCPASTLVSDVQRQPQQAQAAFCGGVKRSIALISKILETAGTDPRRDRAAFLFSAMVGSLALARAVKNVDETESDNILRAVFNEVGSIVMDSEECGA